MSRLVNRIIPGFLQSNLIIASAAVLLALATSALTGDDPHLHVYHVLIFGACLAEYHLHRLVKFYSPGIILRTLNAKWIAGNLVLSWILFLASLPIVLVSFFYLNADVKQIFLISGLITLLYSLPQKGWLGYMPLRKVPLLKTFIVALVWSAVTVLIPATGRSAEIPAGLISWIFTGRFLLILSLALLFDERDRDADRKNGIITIPNIFSRKMTQWLVVLLLVLFAFVSLLRTDNNGSLYPFVSAFLIAVLLTFLMFCDKCRTNPYFYVVFLGGSLIIYSLMIIGGWLIYSVA